MAIAEGVDAAANGVDSSKPRPWILFREQYRREASEELLYERNVDDFDKNVLVNNNEAAFEIRQTYRIRDSRAPAQSEASVENRAVAAASYLSPSRTMHLISIALCHALRTVVRYYPQQDLGGESIEIQWPFAVLVHHYDKLREYQTECVNTSRDQLCERKVDADAHIELLLRYLDQHIMPDVKAEEERNARGKMTWEWSWLNRKPGRIMRFRYDRDDILRPAIIHSVTGGAFENPPLRKWTVQVSSTCS
jgi:hypothetical protein